MIVKDIIKFKTEEKSEIKKLLINIGFLLVSIFYKNLFDVINGLGGTIIYKIKIKL
jgi:hypothetical protein